MVIVAMIVVVVIVRFWITMSVQKWELIHMFDRPLLCFYEKFSVGVT